MFEKLLDVKNRYEQINQLLMDPTVINDNKRYSDLMREYKNLTPIVEKFDEYSNAKENFVEAKAMLDEGGLDAEFKEVVQLQYEESKESMEGYGEELKILLLPKDDDDDRSVIIEIRGGAGGEEAALFAYKLY
ncbi:MAG: PCRF domain-containing protein, partial [Oscillospiraceae bacterium]